MINIGPPGEHNVFLEGFCPTKVKIKIFDKFISISLVMLRYWQPSRHFYENVKNNSNSQSNLLDQNVYYSRKSRNFVWKHRSQYDFSLKLVESRMVHQRIYKFTETTVSTEVFLLASQLWFLVLIIIYGKMLETDVHSLNVLLFNHHWH